MQTRAPTTVLGDWYANILFTRPKQLLLCVNERSLLSVFVPARDLDSLAPRFRRAVRGLLLAIGVQPPMVEAEEHEMAEFGFGPTASRSVLGCMREIALALKFEFEHPRFATLEELELYFSSYIMSPIGMREPCAVALELFARKRSHLQLVH